MLSENDRGRCEKLAAREQASWFERRGLDYVLWLLGGVVLLLALRSSDPREVALLAAGAGIVLGGQFSQLFAQRDRRLLVDLYGEVKGSERTRS